MSNTIIINILGWTGVVGLLLAYVLVSTRKVEGDSTLYQALNLAGSALLVLNSLHFGAYPSVGVNAVWICIAVFALIRGQKSIHANKIGEK